MVTPVPYSPVLEVSPQFSPIPPKTLNVPLAAFGGTVAEATTHLGQVSEQSSNEIFARAISLQQLNRQAAADEAAANFTTQAGEKDANFKSTLGKNAVDSYTPFVSDIRALREQLGANITDPYARIQYDRDTRRIQSWVIMGAAGHAATENKSYILGSLAARNDTIDNTALGNPLDHDSFQSGLSSKSEINDNEASIRGWSTEEAAAALRQKRSSLYSARIQGIAKFQPNEAQRILDEATASGDISGGDVARLNYLVTNQARGVGARIIANQTLAEPYGSSGVSGLYGNYLSLNLSDSSAKALAAVAMAESGGKPGAQGNPGTDASGVLSKGQGAFGIHSWNGQRQADLKNYASREGLDPSNVATQQKFAVYEIYTNPAYAQSKLALMNPNMSVREKIEVLISNYERPAATGPDISSAERAVGYASSAKALSLGELVGEGKRRAAEQFPNDPLIGDYVTQHIESEFSEQSKIKADAERRNREVIDSAILGGGGKVPGTIMELRQQNPDVAAAYDSLPAEGQIQVQKNLISYNRAITRAASEATFNNLIGLSHGSGADQDEFLAKNAFQLGLSQPEIQKVLARQKAIHERRGDDPSINAALRIVQPQLKSAGVSDKDDLNNFHGALISAISDWKQQNGDKALTIPELKKLATQLLTYQSYENTWFGYPVTGFGPNTDLLFKLPLPTEKRDKLLKQNPDMSDSELETHRQEYVRQMFDAAMGFKTEGKQ